MRRILRTVSRHVPGGQRLLRRLNRSRQLRLVHRSGIFDPGWYRRQVPQAPADRDGALRHYLGRGRRQGFAPSPLFDPAWYDPQGWNAKGLDPLVRYLIDGPGRYGPSPLFDERAWAKRFPDARHHPGRGLGHLLATADAATPLPTRTPGIELTFGAATALLAEAESVWAADHDRARRRVTRVWDTGAEREFRRRWQAVPPPSGGDGPLVSVITPVRNRATQVLTAVASVQAQTLTDWELLVVDDGSTDRTAEAVELVAAADRRIRLLRRPHGGVSAARNAGIAAARGRYVAFLDSDNQWKPHFLQLMTAAMDGTGTGAGYTALEIHDGRRVDYLAFEGDLADLEHGNHVDLNVLVVRRDLLLLAGGFDPALRRMVDYDLVVRLARLEPLRLFPFVGAIYDSREEAGPRISTSESTRWDEAVKNHLFGGWDELRAGLADRVAGRVSVLLPVSGPASEALRAITHLQRHAGDADLEIVVLDNGGPRPTWTQLSAALAHRPGIRLTRFSRDVGPVLGANRALRESTGEYVVVVRPEVVVDGPWLQPLVEALADPAVGAAQPLVVDSAGLICTAGGVPLPVAGQSEPLWVPGLQGLPVEDAAGLLGRDVPAAGGPMVALRAADLAAGDGLDPLLAPDAAVADLVWRTSADRVRYGRLVDAPAVRYLPVPAPAPATNCAQPPASAAFPADVHERRVLAGRPQPAQRPLPGELPDPWRAVGLVATAVPEDDLDHPGTVRAAVRVGPVLLHRGLDPDLAEAVPDLTPTADRAVAADLTPTADLAAATGPARTRGSRPGTDPVPATVPRLRWTIRTAAPAGPAGNVWGDVHFAQSLARALAGLGQQVAVDRREATDRPTAALADVTLTLRGLDRVAPVPGVVNLIWVISHPDQVGEEELAGYDRAFAASLSWAREVTARGRVRVEPLLQATDPQLFHPGRGEPGTGPAVLFVGNSRDVLRPMVRDALATGLPLALYGSRWGGLVDPALVAAEYVPNDQLGALYRGAGVVLNDHWEDMARDGFLSNRLFDAVAAGAQVISDPVAGLAEVFGPEVAVAGNAEELSGLLDPRGRPRPDAGLADPPTLRAASRRVRTDHSFEVRARRLLTVALAARQSTGLRTRPAADAHAPADPPSAGHPTADPLPAVDDEAHDGSRPVPRPDWTVATEVPTESSLR